MYDLNTIEKEALLIVTLTECNNYIKNFYEKDNNHTKLNENDIYSFSVNEYNLNNLKNLIGYDIDSTIKNNGNNFAYFSNVLNFIDNYDVNIQKSLFESEKSQFSIKQFKLKLLNILDIIKKQDDFEKLSKSEHYNLIIQTKIMSNKPLNLFGLNVSNFVDILKLYNNKLTLDSIKYVYLSPTEKGIIFVSTNNTLILYNILIDKFNTINLNLNNISAIEYIKKNISNDFIEIYKNKSEYNTTFVDNLYKDNKRTEFYNSKIQEQSYIIK